MHITRGQSLNDMYRELSDANAVARTIRLVSVFIFIELILTGVIFITFHHTFKYASTSEELMSDELSKFDFLLAFTLVILVLVFAFISAGIIISSTELNQNNDRIRDIIRRKVF